MLQLLIVSPYFSQKVVESLKGCESIKLVPGASRQFSIRDLAALAERKTDTDATLALGANKAESVPKKNCREALSHAL
jgi:hypothetical protein